MKLLWTLLLVFALTSGLSNCAPASSSPHSSHSSSTTSPSSTSNSVHTTSQNTDLISTQGVDLSRPAVSLVSTTTTESADADSDAKGELATSTEDHLGKQCWYDGTEDTMTFHPEDPRKYYCGPHLMWYKMNAKRRRMVHRCGKWYKNRRSNQYYSAGSWLTEPVEIHPSNPLLVRRACAWVRRKMTRKVRRYWRNPDTGIWFRSKHSLEYFVAGKWGNFEVSRPHKSNPNKVLEAGRWVLARGLVDQSLWSKRCGRWWLRAPGAGVKSFTFYSRGKWLVLDRYRRLRSNPHYRWKASTCKFVRRKVTALTKKYLIKGRKIWTKKALPGGGWWFRSRSSRWYYKNMKWMLASRHAQSPRWERNPDTGAWSRLTAVQRPSIVRYVKSGKRWYRNKDKRQYWFWGVWKKVKGLSPRRTPTNGNPNIGRPRPDNLQRIVRKATSSELARFLNWFIKRRVTRIPDEKDMTNSAAAKLALPGLVSTLPQRSMNLPPVPIIPRSPFTPEMGLTGEKSMFDIENPSNNRLTQATLNRLQKPVYGDEDTEYGAPEPIWGDVGESPDHLNPPVSDSLRWGRLQKPPRYPRNKSGP